VFCMHGVALAEPFAGGLLVVAHPQIERVAMSAPAARVWVIMRNLRRGLTKPLSYLAFAGISQEMRAPRTVDSSRIPRVATRARRRAAADSLMDSCRFDSRYLGIILQHRAHNWIELRVSSFPLDDRKAAVAIQVIVAAAFECIVLVHDHSSVDQREPVIRADRPVDPPVKNVDLQQGRTLSTQYCGVWEYR
jgi:hypothetical protein